MLRMRNCRPSTHTANIMASAAAPLPDDDKIKQYTAQGWNPDVDGHIVCGFNMRGDDVSDIDEPATRLYLVPKKVLSPDDLEIINTWRQDKNYPTVELLMSGKRSRSERNGNAALQIMIKKGISIRFEDLPRYNLTAASGSFLFLYSTFYG